MGVRRIAPAKSRAGDVPVSQEYPPHGSATFVQGAPLAVDDGALISVTGLSTGAEIAGFASEGATAGVPVGLGSAVVLHKADDHQEFIGQVWDTDHVMTEAEVRDVNEGDVHGLVSQTIDGRTEWLVQGTSAANPTVRITKVLPEHRAVLFVVTHRQLT